MVSPGVAENHSDCAVAEHAECPAAQSDKQKQLALAVRVFFLLFRNTAYLTLCPDDIWLTAVH